MRPTLSAAARWARAWLFETALPRWWPAGTAAGGFHDQIDENGPLDLPLRARVQGRQTWVFAMAGGLGWEGPWLEAVAHGSRFLLHDASGANGLVPTHFDQRGRQLTDQCDLYDQAFILLGHAAAYSALGDERHRVEARDLLARLRARQGRADGGFDEDNPPSRVLLSNPHMHLLEASLTWADLDPDGPWAREAKAITELALRRFIDPQSGRMLEVFDGHARPAAGEDGRRAEPGHQFEWAWLLDRYAGPRGDAQALVASQTLANLARQTGISAPMAVAANAQDTDGAITDPGARLWPQTEWLKAALMMAKRPPGQEHDVWLDQAEAAIAAVRRFLDTPAPGLWSDVMLENGDLERQPSRASSLYHIVGGLAALMRAVEGGERTGDALGLRGAAVVTES